METLQRQFLSRNLVSSTHTWLQWQHKLPLRSFLVFRLILWRMYSNLQYQPFAIASWDWSGYNSCSAWCWDQAHPNRATLSCDLAWNGMRLSNFVSPETSSYWNN